MVVVLAIGILQKWPWFFIPLYVCPFAIWLCSSSTERQSVIVYSLNLIWHWDFLLLIGCGRIDSISVLSLSLQRLLLLFFVELCYHHMNKLWVTLLIEHHHRHCPSCQSANHQRCECGFSWPSGPQTIGQVTIVKWQIPVRLAELNPSRYTMMWYTHMWATKIIIVLSH